LSEKEKVMVMTERGPEVDKRWTSPIGVRDVARLVRRIESRGATAMLQAPPKDRPAFRLLMVAAANPEDKVTLDQRLARVEAFIGREELMDELVASGMRMEEIGAAAEFLRPAVEGIPTSDQVEKFAEERRLLVDSEDDAVCIQLALMTLGKVASLPTREQRETAKEQWNNVVLPGLYRDREDWDNFKFNSAQVMLYRLNQPVDQAGV
jgi:hypothetical protein